MMARRCRVYCRQRVLGSKFLGLINDVINDSIAEASNTAEKLAESRMYQCDAILQAFLQR